ncbi:hypothetical protein MMC25_004900 [Agyrium rufum]|nr:hypothetical protein [Agyrium rufum]
MQVLSVFTVALSIPSVLAVSYSPILPPSYPLAVRNPYLSAWMPGLSVADLPTGVSQFWDGTNLTWALMARVDGDTYSLMGLPTPPADVQPAVFDGAEFTSTHTVFNLTAGNASISLDFFSPVSPANYLRQSLPFSYLTISATTTEDTPVQVYVDIDESWTGQNSSTVSDFSTVASVSYFDLSVNGAYLYSENGDMALWGDVILASEATIASNVTVQLGSAHDVRGKFVTVGTLNNTSLGYSSGDVVAISQDMGTICGTASVTYAVGYVREAEINYLGNARAGYYRATYPDLSSSLAAFFADYDDAYSEGVNVDSTIQSRGNDVAGTNYSTILALSTRQAFGGIDLTISNDTLDTSDFLVFLKEISSDGNVNTIDVIFPAFPAFYVLNPEYIRLLLEPVVQYLATGRFTAPYVIHDIGSTYPNATGHDDQNEEAQPIEETGNLMMLVDAYTTATGNTTFATTYASLFQGYANYLVANGLNISSQLSTDDGAGPLANQTNLAIKAAIGLTAFGNFSGMTNYTTIGLSYADQLYNGGLGTDANKTHFTLEYGNDTTYSTVFNLFPDILLNLSTFPAAAYDMETAFYPTVRAEDGVPLDTRVEWSKTDWMLWAAAYMTDDVVRDMFIDDVYEFITNEMSVNQVPFSDRFYVTGDLAGQFYDFRARPVVGGEFALLALTDIGIFAT